MRIALKTIFLGMLLLALAACGRKINPEAGGAFESDSLSYLQLENQCAKNQIVQEPVSREIAYMYADFQARFPMAFFSIPERFYDYKTPLIISVDDMEKKLAELKAKALDEAVLSKNLSGLAIDLFYLYQHSMRYEGQKCQFGMLMKKQFNDTRPYLEMKDYCREKDCSAKTIDALTGSASQFVQERVVKMCRSFDPSNTNCQAQYNVQSKNRKVSTLLSHYQKRFEKERFDKLFVLRDSHLKFQCEQNEALAVTMNLKVLSNGWDTEKLRGMLSYVSQMWTRGSFKLAIEIVEEKGSDVIEIIPTNGGISYVPDEDNTQVYLSQSLDAITQKKVLAHEFGHVLGFPDCYTEFYDGQKSDLVYYEISAEDTNIMCSLKSGVSVPDNYLQMLREKSCVFN